MMFMSGLHIQCHIQKRTDNSSIALHFYFLLALEPPLGVVFYSPLAGFSLLAYEVS